MPIFEYHCTACAERFERLVLKAGTAIECPSCGSAAVDKLISAFVASSQENRARALQGARRRRDELSRAHLNDEHARSHAYHDHDHDD